MQRLRRFNWTDATLLLDNEYVSVRKVRANIIQLDGGSGCAQGTLQGIPRGEKRRTLFLI